MSKGFPPEFLDELKYRSDIVEVVSQYVPLQKKGPKYFGCCPFHNEKTASFCVNQQEGYYHCFGCGASGDVIKFVCEQESIDFYDAVKLLADRAGLALPMVEQDADYKQKKAHKDVLKQLMRDAARYYRNNLLDEEKGREAREYLLGRGISDEVSKRYGLGLSLDYDSMPKYLRLKQYSLADLAEVGLIANPDRPADAFANRIIVPILNGMDEVVAFGGRIYHGEEDVAKYKNSTNTTLFDKGRTVYGVNRIKRDRRGGENYPYLILVEGYMDVISLGAAGINNAVACMGTALTEGQARELKRMTPLLYVCYDGDGAGRKATLHNIDILRAAGLELKIVSLDDGKDPDETVRQDGVEAYIQKLNEAIPATQYRLQRLEESLDMQSYEGRAKYLDGAVELLRRVGLGEATAYVPFVAERLKGRWTPDGILARLQEALRTENGGVQQAPKQKDPRLITASRIVMSFILDGEEFADPKRLNAEWLYSKHRPILAHILERGERPTIGALMSYGDDEGEIDKILNVDRSAIPDDAKRKEKFYFDTLISLADAYLKDKLEALRVEARSLSGDAQRQAAVELNRTIIKLKSPNLNDKL